MGSLVLIEKGKKIVEDDDSKVELSDYELSKDEFAMMVSNPNRFAKKSFNRNKNRNLQGSYSSEKGKRRKCKHFSERRRQEREEAHG